MYTEQRAEPAWRLLLHSQSHPQPRELPWLWELVSWVFLKLCPEVNHLRHGHGVLELLTQAPSGKWDPTGTGDTRDFILLLFIILIWERGSHGGAVTPAGAISHKGHGV